MRRFAFDLLRGILWTVEIVRMFQFLTVFVVLACCASDDFCVPSAWECYAVNGGDLMRRMRQPSDVGLRVLEIEQKNGLDLMTIQDACGAELTCDVCRQSVYEGGWIFTINVNTGNGKRVLGDVYSQPRSQVQGCLTVVDAQKVAVRDIFPTWDVSNPINYIRYNVDRESLTVRKVFANCDGGYEFFVSATFFYNDLTEAVIRCGKCEGPRIDEGKVITTFSCLSDKKPCGLREAYKRGRAFKGYFKRLSERWSK